MRGLKNLVLRHTRLHSLPAWISSFQQLSYIRLESDELRTLPESFGRLVKLEGLSITGKNFSRLPTSVGHLSQLRNLSLKGGNGEAGVSESGRLTRLPASLMKCKKLYSLILTDQPQLDVVILFGQLALLPALGHVDLTGDNIRTLPPLNWATLRWHSLRLAGNVLTTPPSEMALLPELQELDLRGNPLPESLNRSFHNHRMIQEALLPTSANR